MGVNRTRDKTLTVRVSKTEKAEIMAQVKKAQMSLTDYIITLSRRTAIVLPPDITPIIIELKRIGNNINQIAAKVNSGVTYVKDLGEVIENQKKVYELLCNFMRDERWQP